MHTTSTSCRASTWACRGLGFTLMLSASTPWAASIDDLAWMSGCWVSGDERHFSEEFWTAPRAGSMFGINRSRRDQGPVAFEFLRIEADERGLRYVAQPGGGAATEFRYETSETAQRAAFVNPEHDFPTRIEYWIERGDLHAKVSGSPDSRPLLFAWRPCRRPDADPRRSTSRAVD